MRAILQKRALRFVLLANVVSMLGSGMNSAAVAWHILQATHSELALSTLAVLQTLPAMLMLPFTGVGARTQRGRSRRILAHCANVFSIAATTCGESGVISGSKRATIFPLRSNRNLVKFHLISPPVFGFSEESVRYW